MFGGSGQFLTRQFPCIFGLRVETESDDGQSVRGARRVLLGTWKHESCDCENVEHDVTRVRHNQDGRKQ